MRLKSSFAVTGKFAAALLASFIGLSSAHATVMFTPDTLIGSIDSKNSGNGTELDAIERHPAFQP
jgi:hypothetical protein